MTLHRCLEVVRCCFDEINPRDGILAGFADCSWRPCRSHCWRATWRWPHPGALDLTFDGDGKVTTAIQNANEARSVAIQPDGKIVVAGSTVNDSSRRDFALARYNPDGSLDSTFDGDGTLTTTIGTNDNAHSVAIQADGKIDVAGNVEEPGSSVDISLRPASSRLPEAPVTTAPRAPSETPATARARASLAAPRTIAPNRGGRACCW